MTTHSLQDGFSYGLCTSEQLNFLSLRHMEPYCSCKDTYWLDVKEEDGCIHALPISAAVFAALRACEIPVST